MQSRQSYHLLSQPFMDDGAAEHGTSSIAEYSQRPLPAAPYDLYFTPITSASYESLLEVAVPSPLLYKETEISDMWSRVSSHPAYTLSFDPFLGSPGRDSLQTIAEFSDWLKEQENYRRETLLPPPPQPCHSTVPLDAVECRLSSSASSNSSTLQPSLMFSGRSATPAPNRLCPEIEGLTSACQDELPSSSRPATPVPSLSHSCSATSTVEDTPSTIVSSEFHAANNTTKPMMATTNNHQISPTKASRNKLVKVNTDAGIRNISPPMPSPLYNNANAPFGAPLAHSNTNDSDFDPSYRPFRPAPSAPNHSPPAVKIEEVSAIDWDDDEETSRLTRMKKSFTDLRTAGKLRSDAGARRQQARATKKHDSAAEEYGIVGTNLNSSANSNPTAVLKRENATPSMPKIPRRFQDRSSMPLALLSTTNYPSTPDALADTSALRAHSPTRSPQKLSKKPSIKVPDRKRAVSASVTSSSVKSSVSTMALTTQKENTLIAKRLSLANAAIGQTGTSGGGQTTGVGMARWKRWVRRVLRCSNSSLTSASMSRSNSSP